MVVVVVKGVPAQGGGFRRHLTQPLTPVLQYYKGNKNISLQLFFNKDFSLLIGSIGSVVVHTPSEIIFTK